MKKSTQNLLSDVSSIIPTSYMIFEETVLYVVDRLHMKIGEIRINDIEGHPCLTYIYINDEFRGKGIGSYLVEEMIKMYGHRDIFFQVRSYSESPMNLSEMKKWISRFGFKTVHSYPGALIRKGDAND